MARNAAVESLDGERVEPEYNGETIYDHVPNPPDADGDIDVDIMVGSMNVEIDGLPADPDMDTVRDFLTVSMAREAKALNKLMRYVVRVKPQLAEMQKEYVDSRERTQRLYALATRGLARFD
jgi:hypothetical protein